LRAAGAVILGKTNLHEAALGTTTNNPHWGAAHNPHRQGYTPGGSSGGSGAAVAAGLCDAALGTDTMGSVRLPAAYCGVFGFKPSFDRVPAEGVAPLCWALDHVGPLGRSIAEMEALFAVMAGEGRQAAAARPPRIVRLKAFEDLPLQADVADAYAAGIAWAERRWGDCPIIEVHGFDPLSHRRAALLAIEADAAAIHAGRFDSASGALRPMLDYGAAMPAPKLAAALEELRQARKAIMAIFAQADVILCPTAPQTAFPLSDPPPPSQADFLGLAVFAGAPALSLPLPATGLPVGLQAIAAPGQDWDLLQWFRDWPVQPLATV
jgi:aspartyl-tRNA(Asn)/glutamyl-tRNA(Gln) amidotransferase subunit A